ncbi:RHS repeat-associated core domain-containing protein [Synechococcus sp. PCC 7336]|uniref:RHS repeat-associated core domain-containing protein n=1 Tax=Synechococcus sp. PCC 7336 TaxID=195250 RepID=UPI00034CFEA8|nr:RHS repeat-associated core domain-containing protein [Synechococcus sp. PCC 7336]
MAFGELLGARNAEQVDNLFAGEQFEQELGLYYLRQRYYDPSTGRFISRDAFEGFITNPISQNRYLYANANPVTYTDPSGFFSIGNVSAASVARGTLSVISSPQFLLGAGIGAGAQVTGDFARGERSTVLGVLGAAAFGGLGFVFGPALAGALLKSAIGTVGLSLLVANGLADSFNTLRAGLSSGDPLRAFAGVTSALLDFGLLDGALNPRSLLRNPLRGARGFARSIGGLSDNIARQGGDLVDNIIGGILDNGRAVADSIGGSLEPNNPRSTSFPRIDDRLVLDQADAPIFPNSACGPTACAMVLDTADLDFDVRQLSIDSNLTAGGAGAEDLASALRNSGLSDARALFNQNLTILDNATSPSNPV